MKIWTDIHTLLETNPLRQCTDQIRKFQRYYRSPLYQVANTLKNIDIDILETIYTFTLTPWDVCMRTDVTAVPQSLDKSGRSIQITISGSARNGLIGFRVTIEKQPPYPFHHTRSTIRANPIFYGAHRNSTHTENTSGLEDLQDYAAYENSNQIDIIWVPASEKNRLLGLAKE
ncbi:hypothetical protein N7493_002752 [Penicillium malachiteum]|uniref:Uncharacterized protein n=1 Tax=Penicillium malachiteum TaxID=1324776 RepID=A0AAD6HSF2_9EURO|nr:hypothetical protein N7493_002752 [Penicillium malachiteum]